MAIKKVGKIEEDGSGGVAKEPVVNKLESIETTAEQVAAIPDFDDEPSIPTAPPSTDFSGMGNSLAQDQKQNPCYGELINRPSTDSHWWATQVFSELHIVLSGLSKKSVWWCEERANILNRRPCGLEFDGWTLSWEVGTSDPQDVDARLMLNDVREHLQWVFGPSFIVRPVSQLSDDARNWRFDFKG